MLVAPNVDLDNLGLGDGSGLAVLHRLVLRHMGAGWRTVGGVLSDHAVDGGLDNGTGDLGLGTSLVRSVTHIHRLGVDLARIVGVTDGGGVLGRVEIAGGGDQVSVGVGGFLDHAGGGDWVSVGVRGGPGGGVFVFVWQQGGGGLPVAVGVGGDADDAGLGGGGFRRHRWFRKWWFFRRRRLGTRRWRWWGCRRRRCRS